MRFRIAGTGRYAPPHIETAAELAPWLGRSADWIVSRTGVRIRHVAAEPIEDMAAKAAREALGDRRPDLLIYASTTPRQLIPDTSVFVSRALGLEGVPSFSVHATCLSFLVGLQQAAALIWSGAYQRVLVVSAEMATPARNRAEPESAALLGDGAGAVLIEPAREGEKSGLLGWQMVTWPDAAGLAELPGFGSRRHPLAPETTKDDHFFAMEGPALYKLVRKRATPYIERALADAGVRAEDVDWVVPHQASGPAVQALAAYGFRPERIVDVVGEYGNCIAASIPMALDVAVRDGRIRRGQTVVLAGTGAGVSLAVAVLRY